MENRFIVFQNITIKIYTHLHAFEPIVEAEVIRCQVRTIRRITHQIYVLSTQKCSCLSRE